MVIALVALVALMQLPAGEMRLQCTLTDAGAEAGAAPTELTIVLDVGRRGIDFGDLIGHELQP